MSTEMTVSSSQGRPAEWHDTIMPDGKRLAGTPKNADVALYSENEHWIGERYRTDADRFNAAFQEAVDDYNARQTRDDRKIGAASSKPERQKSYYDGIIDGTFCYGTGKQQETPVQETVLQVGNKDNNGITDGDFDPEHWKELKLTGHEKEASEYALQHLSHDPNKERMKRVLCRAVERIRNLDPEHLVILRADYHGDEPCGTGHVHLAYTLRATGYKTGMESRVASVRALEQMGFAKTPDQEYGIVQLHERMKDIVAEEMAADAEEYGYTAIERKADSGEHRQHSDVDTFRQMAATQEKLEKTAREQENTQKKLDMQAKQQEDTQKKLDLQAKKGKHLIHYFYNFMEELTGERQSYSSYAEAKKALRASMDHYKATTIEEAKQKAQEAAEADFQAREDALEAQKTVLTDLQELKDRLEKIADTDTSRRRFMLAHKFKDGRTLEDAYQQSIKQRRERTEALLEKGLELTAKYEEMKSQDSQQEYH